MDDPSAHEQQAYIDSLQTLYGVQQYQADEMMAANVMLPGSQQAAFPVPTQLTLNQEPSYLFLQQQRAQHLENQLRIFWRSQLQESLDTRDFKNHSLPLARIKKIMKADEDVRMIAAEAPVLFARACEMFILELTIRAWENTDENKRRTLLKHDVGTAIIRNEVFDFLIDVVPREEMKEEAHAIDGPANQSGPYYYVPQEMVTPGMVMGSHLMDHALQCQQHPQVVAPQQQFWPQQQQDHVEQRVSNSDP